MRTVELDDDVVERAELVAQREGKSASQLIGDLVRECLPNSEAATPSWVIVAPPGAPLLTDEMVQQFLDEEDEDYAA